MNKTLQITDKVYFDPISNMVILSVDRITLTITLSEYCELFSEMSVASKAISNFITLSTGLNKLVNSYEESDSYISSGSTLS